MSKVVLIGGSSELGNELVRQLLEVDGGVISDVVSVSRHGSEKPTHVTWLGLDNACMIATLQNLSFVQGDIVIIALGAIGQEGASADIQSLDVKKESEAMFVTGHASLLSLVISAQQLARVGGGTIVFFSSVLESFVVPANLFYAGAKHYVDMSARHLQKIVKREKVHILIVRPGYAATKLNTGRPPSYFSTTPEAIAKAIVLNRSRKVVWIPGILRWVSYASRLPVIGQLLKWRVQKLRS